MKTYISSIIFAIIILQPLGFKWEIKGKITFLGALIIGVITGVIINVAIKPKVNLSLVQLILFELFIISLLSGLAILFAFYRDPERVPPIKKGVILSPADGRLLYIKKIQSGKVPYSQKKGKRFDLSDLLKSDIFNNDGYLIGIGMNFLNVHVNRAPVTGRITVFRHIKGKFFSLKKEESIFQNERALMVIKNDKFAVGIVQIASRLVRKIVTYKKEGEYIRIGERVGMIKFGSQVDVILPNFEGLEIQVKEGDELKAGISIIAKYKHNEKGRKNAI